MTQSISKYEYDKLIENTLNKNNKKELYNIKLPIYGLDTVTGKESVSTYSTTAYKVLVDNEEKYTFFNEYRESEYVLCSRNELSSEPELSSIITLNEIRREEEAQTMAQFIQRKKAEQDRKDHEDEMNRNFTFSRIESSQKRDNRIKQIKLNSMHDLGFYPSIEIEADNNTGNINIELLNNDFINIPFNMIKVDDENLTTGDFKDSPILVVDIDELENNSNYQKYIIKNKELAFTVEGLHFLNRIDYSNIEAGGEYATEETINALADYDVICEDELTLYMATEYSNAIEEKIKRKQSQKRKLKQL